MTPEEIRRRLPSAPEEAIKQLIAIDKQHRGLLAHVQSRGGKDITGLLDYCEHFLLRWNPTKLEPVLKELVDSFGRSSARATRLASNNSSEQCAN